MAAAVEEDPHAAVVATDEDHRLPADLAHDIVAGARNLALVPEIDPYFVPDGVELALEDRGIAIEAAIAGPISF